MTAEDGERQGAAVMHHWYWLVVLLSESNPPRKSADFVLGNCK